MKTRSMLFRLAVPILIAAILFGYPAARLPGYLAYGQIGSQLLITMNLAERAKPVGGSYFIAFTVDDTILQGPQSDSSNWTHYVVYRGGRFFFGRVPRTPFKPFEFQTVRPPEPYLFGQILPDGRTLRVRVALSDLVTGASLPVQIKINFITVDEFLRPLDALGRGATERFAFVTLDLRRENYVAVTDPTGDAPDRAFDITGGDIQVTTP